MMGRLRVHGPIRRDEMMPRIRAMRDEGRTQEEIAVEIGCAASTIQKWLDREKPDAKDGRTRRARAARRLQRR
jgi:hypothetical protein